jgi:hypothetical protein
MVHCVRISAGVVGDFQRSWDMHAMKFVRSRYREGVTLILEGSPERGRV